MRVTNKIASFESLKEKEIHNVWCINGGGDHMCGDCCEEDTRGGTDEDR